VIISSAAASGIYNLVTPNLKNKFSYTGSLGACSSLQFGLDNQQGGWITLTPQTTGGLWWSCIMTNLECTLVDNMAAMELAECNARVDSRTTATSRSVSNINYILTAT
jgi:hypothetical protein